MFLRLIRGSSISGKQHVLEDIAKFQVLVYSKTYCPYCVKAKKTFESMEVPFKHFDLDLMKNEAEIEKGLFELTKQETVPNIFISGVHVGGYSDLAQKLKEGIVQDLLKKAQIPYKSIT